MSTTITFNFSIAVNPIPFFVNLVVIYSYVAEEGRLHDKIANPVCGSGWNGFRMFHAVMFVAAVALVATPAVILFVIPIAKDRGTQIFSGAINTTGDTKGTDNGSIYLINIKQGG